MPQCWDIFSPSSERSLRKWPWKPEGWLTHFHSHLSETWGWPLANYIPGFLAAATSLSIYRSLNPIFLHPGFPWESPGEYLKRKMPMPRPHPQKVWFDWSDLRSSLVFQKLPRWFQGAARIGCQITLQALWVLLCMSRWVLCGNSGKGSRTYYLFSWFSEGKLKSRFWRL